MVVRIKNLRKAFDGKEIIKDLTFDMPSEGNICFYAPSGSGKTTLLRIIAGLTKADGGYIEGCESKKLSYIFQEDRLLPWLNAKENIDLVNRTDISSSDWLDMVGLKQDLEKKPDELSGGMRQRVAIARALSYSGDILLMDEPFKGLDSNIKRKVADLIMEKGTQSLKILITHDLDEIFMMGEKIYIFSQSPMKLLKIVDLNKNNSNILDMEWYKEKKREIKSCFESVREENQI